jgi:hypothetical protein
MKTRSQTGSVVTELILIIALIAALAFGVWAFKGRQDFKKINDKSTATAVAAAQKATTDQLQKQFDEQSKSPNKTYVGSPTYGTLTFNYPKTWSAYVDESGSSEPINGYFQPNQVPGLQSNIPVALRVELLNTAYAQVVQQFNSPVSNGKLTASAYIPPKMKGVANIQPGTRLDGQIAQNQQGAIVIIKLRDKTLQIYTQSPDFMADFNNTVLASLTFTP